MNAFLSHKAGAVFSVLLLQAISLNSILPSWVWVLVFVIAFSLFTAVRKNLPEVSTHKVYRTSLLISAMLGFWFSFQGQYTVETASVLLFLVFSMKAIELHHKKDFLVFAYTSLYLSGVSMLFEQGLLHMMLQLCCVAIVFIMLGQVNGTTLNSFRSQWASLLKLAALSLPFVVVLFLFFPRLAPLWSIPIKTSNASMGMSETLSPGDIAKLSQSDERVFRASFKNMQQPAKQTLYWRAIVLDQFDGTRWTKSPDARREERKQSNQFSSPATFEKPNLKITDTAHYDILLAPQAATWAFALDGSSAYSSNLVNKDMGLFEMRAEVVQPTLYRMTLNETSRFYAQKNEVSDAEVIGQKLPTAVLGKTMVRKKSNGRFDRQYPQKGNPKTRALIDQMRVDSASEQDFVASLLTYFATGGFAYTLEPPLLGDDFTDDFLFSSQRGFCEHFAGSMAYMLRLGGVPARVVLGYAGGEYNTTNDYWLIRQYDAHAWVEANIDGSGWVRLDPTALIAPERVRFGLERAIPIEFAARNALAALSSYSQAFSWLKMRMDEINYQWQLLVVGYGQSQQQSLMKRWLGSDNIMNGFKVVGVSTLLFGAMVVMYLVWQRYGRLPNATAKTYMLYVDFMAMLGHPRELGETPNAYLQRISANNHSLFVRLLAMLTRKLELALYHV